jgi:hypothetical protein
VGLWLSFIGLSTGNAAEPLQDGPGGLSAHVVDGDCGLCCGCTGVSEVEARLLRAAASFVDLRVCSRRML